LRFTKHREKKNREEKKYAAALRCGATSLGLDSVKHGSPHSGNITAAVGKA